MTIKATVTNGSDQVIGRAGYRFDPGQTKPVEVSASQFPEVYQHPDLSAVVVSVENPGQLPDEPERFGVTVEEGAVQSAATVSDLSHRRDFIPTEGSFESTTLDR